ncbi:LuxR C-terminal-related transcriptional regulator [Methylobacterium sp. J-076]|uniref:LuxR C-terminal-related transcriptional regulator n=1 Tax=Methylobacterium sp. J-076 TaxID=2836655 RepID=UPI001FB87474|nr:response regulator transcription factor [Methylobacterium sp. J-076]MCJ2015422.1 response regulator transcription factor [Methylobacterium sp. J-076]
MNTPVGVLILDEPDDLCATVRASLEHMPEVSTIGEEDLAHGGRPAVALVFLDEVRLADGVARIVGLKERQPTLRVLVSFKALTADDLRAVLAAGADAFVARTKSPRDLGAAILALAEGADCLVRMEPVPAAEVMDGQGLTPREAEVLRFLSAGFSNKEVARRLALSVRTVETHRLNLRRKTQTGRLKDLVSLARQLGLSPVVDAEPVRRGGESRGAAPQEDHSSRH